MLNFLTELSLHPSSLLQLWHSPCEQISALKSATHPRTTEKFVNRDKKLKNRKSFFLNVPAPLSSSLRQLSGCEYLLHGSVEEAFVGFPEHVASTRLSQ